MKCQQFYISQIETNDIFDLLTITYILWVPCAQNLLEVAWSATQRYLKTLGKVLSNIREMHLQGRFLAQISIR